MKELKLSSPLPSGIDNYLILVNRIVAGIIKGALEELTIPCDVEAKKAEDEGELMIEVRIFE